MFEFTLYGTESTLMELWEIHSTMVTIFTLIPIFSSKFFFACTAFYQSYISLFDLIHDYYLILNKL